MLRSDLKTRLDHAQLSYAELACKTTNPVVFDAAYCAANSVKLTAERVMNPRTNEQRRRPAEYATKRLADIAIRFNRKLSALPADHTNQILELRSAADELRSVLKAS